MSENFKDTWEHYVTSWRTASDADRRALFARCLDRDCQYTDPLTVALPHLTQRVPATRGEGVDSLCPEDTSTSLWQEALRQIDVLSGVTPPSGLSGWRRPGPARR
jgi:hypothetical protein